MSDAGRHPWFGVAKAWVHGGGLAPEWSGAVWKALKWPLIAAGALLGILFRALMVSSPDKLEPRGIEWIVDLRRFLSPHRDLVLGILVLWLLTLAFLFWASRSFRQRRKVIEVLRLDRHPLGSRLPTVATMTANEFLPKRRRLDPVPSFRPRTVTSRLGDDVAREATRVIGEAWRRERGVAVTGAAGMGKTRLIHAAAKALPADTLILIPSDNVGELPETARSDLAYLRGKRVLLVFDDLNYFAGKASPSEIAAAVEHVAGAVATAATVTTATIPQVQNDKLPRLRDFFTSLQQLRLIRMTDEQIAELAESKSQGVQSDAAGNPGMLLFDLDSVRAEIEGLGTEQTDVLNTLWAMFVNGIGPIDSLLLLDTVNGICHRELKLPALRETLESLERSDLLRAVDPAQPEEGYLMPVLGEEAALSRLNDLAAHFDARANPEQLFLLATSSHFREDYETAARLWQSAADHWREDERLVEAAMAMYNLGIDLEAGGRPLEEVESSYQSARDLGVQAGTPEGLVQSAMAMNNLGVDLEAGGGPLEAVESSYESARDLGVQAGTPEGLVQSATAMYNLGVALQAGGRALEAVESSYHAARDLGVQAGTPEGLVQSAKAMANLGVALRAGGRPLEAVESSYESARDLGVQAGTPEGLVKSATAMYNLGIALRAGDRPLEAVESSYQSARDLGAQAGTPEGLVQSAMAMANLGVDLRAGGRPLEAVESSYESARDLGVQAGTPEGLVQSATAMYNLGIALRAGDRPLEAVESSYQSARDLGVQAGTPEGLVQSAKAMANLGVALRAGGRPLEEVESSYEAARDLGAKAGTPKGLEVAGRVDAALEAIRSAG